MAEISVIQGDITRIQVDAIVNAANSRLAGGGGVDGAIHKAGGPSIMEECRAIIARIGSLPTGEAVITTAGRLPAKYVIHTVGPVYDPREASLMEDQLARCYTSSLHLALEYGIKSIAFPNISTGVYGFPKRPAAEIAVRTVESFTDHHEGITKIMYVCFDTENYNLYRNLIA